MSNKVAGWLMLIWGIILVPAALFGGPWNEDVVMKRIGVTLFGAILIAGGIAKLLTSSPPKDESPTQPD